MPILTPEERAALIREGMKPSGPPKSPVAPSQRPFSAELLKTFTDLLEEVRGMRREARDSVQEIKENTKRLDKILDTAPTAAVKIPELSSHPLEDEISGEWKLTGSNRFSANLVVPSGAVEKRAVRLWRTWRVPIVLGGGYALIRFGEWIYHLARHGHG